MEGRQNAIERQRHNDGDNFMKFHTDNLAEMKEIFNPRMVDKALKTGLSKTTNFAKKQISKFTRERYNVKAGLLSNKQTVKIIKSTERGYSINYQGYRLPMSAFGATKTYVAKGHKRLSKRTTNRIYDTISVKVLRKGRKKQMRGEYGFGVFTARGKTGRQEHLPVSHRAINIKQTTFERMTKSRLKIQKATALSVPQMVQTKEIQAKVVKVVDGEMEKQFTSAMNSYLDRAAGLAA